jgi:hypothetical protein
MVSKRQYRNLPESFLLINSDCGMAKKLKQRKKYRTANMAATEPANFHKYRIWMFFANVFEEFL